MISKPLVLSSWQFHSPSSEIPLDKDFKKLNKLGVKEGYSTSKVKIIERNKNVMRIIRIFVNTTKIKM